MEIVPPQNLIGKNTRKPINKSLGNQQLKQSKSNFLKCQNPSHKKNAWNKLQNQVNKRSTKTQHKMFRPGERTSYTAERTSFRKKQFHPTTKMPQLISNKTLFGVGHLLGQKYPFEN